MRSYYNFMKKFLLLTTLLYSCETYTPSTILLPPHIKKISVEQFTNKTQFYGLEDKLTLAIIDEFIRDGKYQITTERDADGVINGLIKNYVREPLTYDENQVAIEYKLWVVVDVKFFDKVNNLQLWEEPNFESAHRYYIETKPELGGITEERAREILWENLAKDIVKRTIYGFGAATGTTIKKLPERQIITPP